MVVQFPPAGPEDEPSGRRRAGRDDADRPATDVPRLDGRRPGARRSGRAGTDGGLATVTYLPGAQPSEAAEDALARVRAVPRREAAGGDDRERSARDRKAARAGGVAIHQLARRGMSRWELEQVLAKREVDEATAVAELDRLESIGLVDDAALAISLVYAMHTRKGSGRGAIEQELRRRHFHDDVIADAMAGVDGHDELERATELATARARQLRAVEYEVAARRLSGYLARKGYDADVIRPAVRSALDGHPRGSSPGGGVRFR
jgi:regulatory protein